jgi:catechol 2,3-dioxygenase-like lactoylglutathione lyase family enzyme
VFAAILLAFVADAAIAQQIAVKGVAAVGVTVADLDRSVDFYTHVLHFQKESEVELSGAGIEHFKGVFGVRVRVARLRLGSEELELSEYLAPRGRVIPADSHSNDLWFQHVAIVVSDMDQAYKWLRENHVQHVSSGPQTLPDWNTQAAGIQAFYFRDPDGHVLEIIHFPPGKGDPRWQQHGPELFQGIDHTAIGVSNTDASLAYYRDQLGMRVAGTSENYGDEQEHLNNVFGARLRISSLRAAHGPGVELLEYLAPRTGRSIPPDAAANDLAHWETILEEDNLTGAWEYFSQGHARLISSGVQKSGIDEDNHSEGFLMADPDGHVIALRKNTGIE